MMSSVWAGAAASLSLLQRLLGPPSLEKQKNVLLSFTPLLSSHCCPSPQGFNSSVSAEAALHISLFSSACP